MKQRMSHLIRGQLLALGIDLDRVWVEDITRLSDWEVVADSEGWPTPIVTEKPTHQYLVVTVSRGDENTIEYATEFGFNSAHAFVEQDGAWVRVPKNTAMAWRIEALL
ncbi:hypothetical protein DWB68_10225 [Galactobacter valiniphilus]|uniref:Uncharacterized protein n=2 Tax=Galactobacter valiniphilus TaxID=2676122 RepID=A0A399J8J7_9MICC|nr:hypothetical protein DWB68_10225 [Galactobacter valiniphilus]